MLCWQLWERENQRLLQPHETSSCDKNRWCARGLSMSGGPEQKGNTSTWWARTRRVIGMVTSSMLEDTKLAGHVVKIAVQTAISVDQD